MRVLVTVSSRHGGTGEIGRTVAQVLRDSGLEVAETDPDEVQGLEGVDAVVLGSSVYVGRLAAALRELVDREAGRLAALPVWLFWSGPVGNPPLPATEPDDVGAVARRVGAREVKCFPGRLRREELGLAERALVAMIDAEPGDFRDFADVEEWAAGIARDLSRPYRVSRG